MKNSFNEADTQATIARINQLTPDTQALWGKMSVAQMLAHCCVAYEMFYEKERFPKNNFIAKFFLKSFVKPMVVGPKPYKKNQQTAPVFLIKDERNFDAEQAKLIAFLEKTQQLGADHFHGKESHSFGKLTSDEWNVLFSKHLDHHLTQFGV
ncbi:MAG: DUF1569 domain-containing protein [Bacteroidota bacterium]